MYQLSTGIPSQRTIRVIKHMHVYDNTVLECIHVGGLLRERFTGGGGDVQHWVTNGLYIPEGWGAVSLSICVCG